MSSISWTKIANMNLAEAMRRSGYDITMYMSYSRDAQSDAKRKSIREIMKDISTAYERESKGGSLGNIKKGVYVICVSNPFTIRYENGDSSIIYIGRGNVTSRIKGHFDRSLFDFMQSLSGTNFDFYFCEPKKTGGGKANDYYKHIEFLLLDGFKSKFGGHNRSYPLLNKNAGSRKNLSPGQGWDKPLKLSGKKPAWALEPTKHWTFAPLDSTAEPTTDSDAR